MAGSVTLEIPWSKIQPNAQVIINHHAARYVGQVLLEFKNEQLGSIGLLFGVTGAIASWHTPTYSCEESLGYCCLVMFQHCAVTKCKRESIAVCHCCKENLCLSHLEEHHDSPISQLNLLVDEIDALEARLETTDTHQTIEQCRQKLDKWRVDYHKMIDHLYDEKCQELDQYMTKKITKQRDNITLLKSEVSERIREQQATHEDIKPLIEIMHDLKTQMNDIENTCLQIDINSLPIDNNLIRIKEWNRDQFDLTTLPLAFKSISTFAKQDGVKLASNDRFMLIGEEKMLYLVDKTLKIVKQKKCNATIITDMCWSSALDRFIVIMNCRLFLVDERTMSIEYMHTNIAQQCIKCACLDTKLFLLEGQWRSSDYVGCKKGPSIIEFNLLPLRQLIKEWKSPITCSAEEWIYDIQESNGKLALLISESMDCVQKKLVTRLELRSPNTFDCLWSYRLDMGLPMSCDLGKTCVFVNHNEVLIIMNKNNLALISTDGSVKETYIYYPQPVNIHLFGSNILAITTATEVNFHEL
ncbi:unnamed protein product [Adineta steineri]|uniref:Uncharacterized protein n=1 Tax=Adineta steineri TaxID=433720 RepID=A0A816CAJ7_9BILA|nr:unnamed protein product [Adineta steineri]CAF1622214.1 unnamed protein product [Adineta steineri]